MNLGSAKGGDILAMLALILGDGSYVANND